MKQTLFHGGTEIIRQPEIREPNRTLDFGRGFYLTTSPEQAERWVRSRLRNGVTGGYVHTERALECLKYLDHYPVGADDGDNE